MSSFLPTFIRACRSSCASSQQPSLTLAFHLAQQLSSHVVIGFPERAPNIPALRSSRGNASPSSPFDARPHEARSAKTSTMPSEHSAYNSAALFAPDRSLLHIFRKHFLFESDEVWADQGSGFEVLHTPSLGNICVAICMDLNPFRFRTPFEKYELASFCAQKDVDLLVMPMAWLLPKDEKEKIIDKDKAETEHKPSLGTINYWAMRCMPLFNPQGTPSHAATTISSNHPSHGGAPKTTYFIATNRAGTERSSTFAGRLSCGDFTLLSVDAQDA
uniref:Protein n-terminal asparagine amidohydrolase n=1 Tax=Melanopsichium pennsylvanicum 4 TaxID=1398559 RepID=A0A077QWE1_9BASI|nr:protein n-terminal asparagine amidohydrolase [Melanopsichium pennsylvanicum 4]